LFLFFTFHPRRVVSQPITMSIEQQYREPWLTWGSMIGADREIFYQSFKFFFLI